VNPQHFPTAHRLVLVVVILWRNGGKREPEYTKHGDHEPDTTSPVSNRRTPLMREHTVCYRLPLQPADPKRVATPGLELRERNTF